MQVGVDFTIFECKFLLQAQSIQALSVRGIVATSPCLSEAW